MFDRSQYPDDPAGSSAIRWPAERENARSIFDRLMHAISEHDTIDELAQHFAVICAETFGDLCSITILNVHNEMMHMGGLYDTEPRSLALLEDVVAATADIPRDKGIAARVMLSGQPVLIQSIPDEEIRAVSIPEFVRYIEVVGISTLMAAPLKGRTGTLGAVSLSRHRGHPAYSDSELTLLSDMSLRIAIALENIILVESLRAQLADLSNVKAALNVSEGRFHSIFQSATLGIQVINAIGTVVDVNPAFEDMTGWSKAELVGQFFGRFLHPEDAPAVAHAFTEIKLKRPPDAAFEHRVLRKDGSIAWLRTNFAAIRSGAEAETVDLIVAMHENVTGRKRTEQYFQAVLDATPDALVMADAQGRILLINQQAERFFGYARHELLGMQVEALMPERFRGEHPDSRETYLREPQTRPMGHGRELSAIRHDGTEVPVDVSLSYLEVEGTSVIVAAVRDITQRRQREAALIRSQRSLAEAQRVARVGSFEFDLASGRLEASEEALNILGVSADQIYDSESFQKHIHPDDRERVIELTRRVVVTRQPEEFEFRVATADGKVRIVRDRVAPYFDANGQPTRLLGTIHDVTEPRQAEKEMAELKSHLQDSLELERVRLAQDLHDGPMQDLYGAVYRLDELHRQVDRDVESSIQDVNRQIQETIEELRDIAKELRPPALSNFGLEKAIRSYVQDFQDKHPAIKVHVSLAHDHQLLPEEVRLTLFRVLQQALANILRHSQATEVKVRFTLDAEEARLVITDNGRGFDVPANWMNYVRGGHYGLAGAAERLNALGGSLRVESEPGHATTVTAVVPWSPPAEG